MNSPFICYNDQICKIYFADARIWLSSFRKKVNYSRDKLNRLKKDLTIFSISQPDSGDLNTLLKVLK